jgi:hypothetical protein
MSSMNTQGQDTSGTYAFAPSMGECVLYAYGLCQVRRTALTQQHFVDARMATNLLLGIWSADGVNLWQVDLQTFPLIQGVSTYQVPSNTIVVLDTYYTISNGTINTDRIMLPISRSEYATYPNKKQQGGPTVFWFDRLLSPTITIWPVPNGQQSSLSYYRLRQTQDANFTNGTEVEIPYYFLAAYCYGLGAMLAETWNPARAPSLQLKADKFWGIASRQNIETANTYIAPTVNSYYS